MAAPAPTVKPLAPLNGRGNHLLAEASERALRTSARAEALDRQLNLARTDPTFPELAKLELEDELTLARAEARDAKKELLRLSAQVKAAADAEHAAQHTRLAPPVQQGAVGLLRDLEAVAQGSHAALVQALEAYAAGTGRTFPGAEHLVAMNLFAPHDGQIAALRRHLAERGWLSS
jgi:hypothetical protein